MATVDSLFSLSPNGKKAESLKVRGVQFCIKKRKKNERVKRKSSSEDDKLSSFLFFSIKT